MKRKTYTVIVLFFFLLFNSAYGEKKESLSLSLEDCIVKAMENNLRVAIEVINPDLADASLARAKEIFLPRFDLSFGSQKTENPSYWWITGTENQISKYTNYSVALVQQLPTGGNFSLSLNNYKSDTNQAFQIINPRFGSTLQLDFTQPLLRNFGFKISRKEILIAQNNLDISRNQFKSVLMDTIYTVQEAYWNLVYAIEDFSVKEQSLQLARDLLAKNRKEVEVGRIAKIEILNAEAVVAQREADILQSETLIKKSEDFLKNVLNISPGENLQEILPLDKPEFVKKMISFEEAVQIARANRPDLKMQKKYVETNELNLQVAKNQLLPGLDLTFSYWSPGISGDRILYLNDDPFTGIVVGTEKGSAGDSIQDAFKLLYNNWSIGLTLSIPVANFLSKADYVRARMELEKSNLELENTEKTVLLEIRDAVRDVETNAKRVEAYRISRELAQKRLEAEERKLNVGLTTNYFVLEFQEALATARSLEIKSLVDYSLALAKLERALGTSLESRNIKVR